MEVASMICFFAVITAMISLITAAAAMVLCTIFAHAGNLVGEGFGK